MRRRAVVVTLSLAITQKLLNDFHKIPSKGAHGPWKNPLEAFQHTAHTEMSTFFIKPSFLCKWKYHGNKHNQNQGDDTRSFGSFKPTIPYHTYRYHQQGYFLCLVCTTLHIDSSLSWASHTTII